MARRDWDKARRNDRVPRAHVDSSNRYAAFATIVDVDDLQPLLVWLRSKGCEDLPTALEDAAVSNEEILDQEDILRIFGRAESTSLMVLCESASAGFGRPEARLLRDSARRVLALRAAD